MVDGNSSRRDYAALSRFFAWPSFAPARASDPIFGFRRLATRLAGRERARGANESLAKRAGRRALGARTSHVQAAAGGSEFPRRGRAVSFARGIVGEAEVPRARTARDAIHGAGGCLRGASPSLHRPGRYFGWHADFRPDAQRDGAADRTLPEYRRPALAIQRTDELPHIVATGPRARAERVRTSRYAAGAVGA